VLTTLHIAYSLCFARISTIPASAIDKTYFAFSAVAYFDWELPEHLIYSSHHPKNSFSN